MENTKVVALPTAVALLFQIISRVATSKSQNVEEDDYEVIDEQAAEYAVEAIYSLLPALLKADDPPHESERTKAACQHLQAMLDTYSLHASHIFSKAKAADCAEKIKGASSSGLPILENSYDLWLNFHSSGSLFFSHSLFG